MSIVYLVGMPGCGKSTIGRLTARAVGMKFVDLDDLIVSRTGQTISQLFERGEDVFRREETEALMSITGEKATIVATGGGIVLSAQNVAWMRKNGKVVWIETPVETILARTDFSNRPLLKDDQTKIHQLYQKRLPLYRSAAHCQIVCDGNMLHEVEQLKERIK